MPELKDPGRNDLEKTKKKTTKYKKIEGEAFPQFWADPLFEEDSPIETIAVITRDKGAILALSFLNLEPVLIGKNI